MKLLSLKAYRTGFTGILEDRAAYVLFCLPKSGPLKQLHCYSKNDFTGVAHFKSVITKFVPIGSFLSTPHAVETLSAVELHRMFRSIASSRKGRSDRLAYRHPCQGGEK